MREYEILKNCVEFIRKKTDFVPEIALVLGSGLGALAGKTDVAAIIDYADIPDFPISTVSGHAGRFVLGTLGSKKVIIMQGRVHYYEGYSMREVVRPTRIMRMLGADKLLLTNVSGCINTSFSVGDFVLLCGQIASFVPSPLIGENVEELGVRFPDMSEIYSARLRNVAMGAAASRGVALREGVYLQVTGPNYESPEEIRSYRTLGADLVGMSTAVEAIAARHAGFEVCGVSCVANMACGITAKKLSHEEVKTMAARRAESFRALITGIIEDM